MKNYFVYNNQVYYHGTVVKINPNYKNVFGYRPYLIFNAIKDNNYHHFHAIGKSYECYIMHEQDIYKFIESIAKPVVMNPKYNEYQMQDSDIDGICIATFFYIFAITFILFTKGIVLKVVVIALVTSVYNSWKYGKKNGK